MNTATKGVSQTKAKLKAAKPAKTLSKAKRKKMSVAEVEAAATTAIKSKKLSMSEKARKLQVVAELLTMAQEKALSKNGEWLLAHVNDPSVDFDPAGHLDKRAAPR